MANYLILCIVALAANSLASSLDNSITEVTRQKDCEHLNSVQANYSTCCQYPQLVMYKAEADKCAEDCKVQDRNELDDPNDECCRWRCYLSVANIMKKVEGQEDFVLNEAGIIASYMLSVQNDTRWEEVVKQSVTKCYNKEQNPNELNNCGVPQGIFTLASCVYLEDFINCPVWNPFKVDACQYTKQYVQDCLAQ